MTIDIPYYCLFSGSGQMARGFEDKEGTITMKCMRCGREAYKSTTTEAIELGFGVLVIRRIAC